jgi:hypothetical protein
LEFLPPTGEQKNTWLKTTDGLWVSSLFTAESKPDRPNDPTVEVAPVAEVEAPKPQEKLEEPAMEQSAEQDAVPVNP